MKTEKLIQNQFTKTLTNESLVTLLVVAATYDEGNIIQVRYDGSLLECLLAISENHSYGFDSEDKDLNHLRVLEEIDDQNGDGCDHISITLFLDGQLHNIL